MKSYIIIFIASQLILWSCTKKDAGCSLQKPVIITDSSVTAGDTMSLSVTGVNRSDIYMYTWYGPNGFSSHDSAPSLPGVSAGNSGRYYVDIITNGGCIYTATSDSILIGAPHIPCNLTNNVGSISGATDFYFSYITGSANGGSYFIEANSAEGDAEIEFFGTGRPGAGIFSAQPLGGSWGPGNVHITFNDGFSNWYGDPGTVYVSSSNNKITVSACNIQFTSDAFGYKTTGSFEITSP